MHPKFKPMLAGSPPKEWSPEKFFEELRYPVWGTPKYDGIRCVITDIPNIPHYDRTPMTRSMKQIPNKAMRTLLSSLPCHLDGELMATGSFQNCQSAVMSHTGEWDFKYYVFDMVPHDEMRRCFGITYDCDLHYLKRVEYLKTLQLPEWCVVVEPKRIERGELEAYNLECLENKYEGCIIRTAQSPYKYGRSSFREQYMIKVKQFVDDEAVVIGVNEEMHNANEPKISELGYRVRPTLKANMQGKGTLGSLRVRHPTFGEFNIGTGFNAGDRIDLWSKRESLLNRVVTFKYQPQGVKDAPRIPVFKAFRDKRDMDSAPQGDLAL
jgi:DNA ligase-1